MRLLVVHEHQTAPGQGGGGAESLLRDLTASLKMRGHEVAWWQGQGTIQQAIDAFKPDVVQLQTIHNYLPNWLDIARYVQDSGIPNVWAVMDYWPFCKGRMLLTHSTYGDSCAAVNGVCDGACQYGRSPSEWLEAVNRSPVVAYNQYTADIYRRNGLRCDFIVELGIDTGMFRPDESKRDAEVSVYTSTAWPEYPVKGMQTIKAAVRLGAPVVNLISHVPRERVAEGLKRAHIYVFPSIYEETFGLSLCEAMASGCAVIASDVAGARAQVHPGMGFLVPPREPMALMATIELLLGSPQLRLEMGQAAREHVKSQHSLAAMGERWEAVYREVMTNGS